MLCTQYCCFYKTRLLVRFQRNPPLTFRPSTQIYTVSMTLYAPYCHGDLKIDMSTLFTTFFLYNIMVVVVEVVVEVVVVF